MLGARVVPRPQPQPTPGDQGGDHRALPARAGGSRRRDRRLVGPPARPLPGRDHGDVRLGEGGRRRGRAGLVDRRRRGRCPVARSEQDPVRGAYRGAAASWAEDASLAYVPLARHLVARLGGGLPGPRALDAGAGTGAAGDALRELGASVVSTGPGDRTCSRHRPRSAGPRGRRRRRRGSRSGRPRSTWWRRRSCSTTSPTTGRGPARAGSRHQAGRRGPRLGVRQRAFRRRRRPSTAACSTPAGRRRSGTPPCASARRRSAPSTLLRGLRAEARAGPPRSRSGRSTSGWTRRSWSCATGWPGPRRRLRRWAAPRTNGDPLVRAAVAAVAATDEPFRPGGARAGGHGQLSRAPTARSRSARCSPACSSSRAAACLATASP